MPKNIMTAQDKKILNHMFWLSHFVFMDFNTSKINFVGRHPFLIRCVMINSNMTPSRPGKIDSRISLTTTLVSPVTIVQFKGTFTIVAVMAPTIINPKTAAHCDKISINPELNISSIKLVPIV